MESDAIINMAKNSYHHHYFITDVIISDDNITMKDVINHPRRIDWIQVMNKYKGNYFEEIPLPYFLADPSHKMKVVTKHVFIIENYGKAQ